MRPIGYCGKAMAVRRQAVNYTSDGGQSLLHKELNVVRNAVRQAHRDSDIVPIAKLGLLYDPARIDHTASAGGFVEAPRPHLAIGSWLQEQNFDPEFRV